MEGIKDIAFCGEIVLQVKIARRAAERLEATKENFDQIEVWCSIQSILVAAGNISKILSPPDKKNINRVVKDYSKCLKWKITIFYLIAIFVITFSNTKILELKNGLAKIQMEFMLI